jgi:hypothetical protein
LRQRPAGIRGLPTTHQIELIGQAVQYVALTAQNSDWLALLPISHDYVEVAAEYQVCSTTNQGNTVENVLHRSDVPAFSRGSVNAEHC